MCSLFALSLSISLVFLFAQTLLHVCSFGLTEVSVVVRSHLLSMRVNKLAQILFVFLVHLCESKKGGKTQEDKNADGVGHDPLDFARLGDTFFSLMDKDGDGIILPEETLDFKAPGVEAPSKQDAESLFRDMDRNADGKVTREEAKTSFATLASALMAKGETKSDEL